MRRWWHVLGWGGGTLGFLPDNSIKAPINLFLKSVQILFRFLPEWWKQLSRWVLLFVNCLECLSFRKYFFHSDPPLSFVHQVSIVWHHYSIFRISSCLSAKQWESLTSESTWRDLHFLLENLGHFSWGCKQLKQSRDRNAEERKLCTCRLTSWGFFEGGGLHCKPWVSLFLFVCAWTCANVHALF